MRDLLLIKQRGDYDCGVACLAMALRISYDEALAALGRDPNEESAEFEGEKHVGVIPEEITFAAFNKGVPCCVVPVYDAYTGTRQYAWRDVFAIPRIHDIANHLFSATNSCQVIFDGSAGIKTGSNVYN